MYVMYVMYTYIPGDWSVHSWEGLYIPEEANTFAVSCGNWQHWFALALLIYMTLGENFFGIHYSGGKYIILKGHIHYSGSEGLAALLQIPLLGQCVAGHS